MTGPEPRSPFFRGGKGELDFFPAFGFDAAVAAGEFFDSSGGIDELLLTGKERMAGGTDTDFNVCAGRAGAVGGSTSADDGRLDVFGMDISFHGCSEVAERLLAKNSGSNWLGQADDSLAETAFIAVGGVWVNHPALGCPVND